LAIISLIMILPIIYLTVFIFLKKIKQALLKLTTMSQQKAGIT